MRRILAILMVMRFIKLLTVGLFSFLTTTGLLHAHCQVPCGIYADDVVFGELKTDVETIEKAMVQIVTIGDSDEKDWNQLVRWVTNKEAHAQNIQETMSAYFLAQRIKLGQRDTDVEAYRKLVDLSHEIIVLAMKCKQGTSLEDATRLGEAVHEFQHAYAGK